MRLLLAMFIPLLIQTAVPKEKPCRYRHIKIFGTASKETPVIDLLIDTEDTWEYGEVFRVPKTALITEVWWRCDKAKGSQ